MSKIENFQSLLSVVNEVGHLYENLVYIGGIAVYLHSINNPLTEAYAEATADADLYISLASLSQLRSIEELTQTPRLKMQTFQKEGFSFDVYAERQSTLPVPYAQVVAHAVTYDGVQVASLEDLLVLKLAAAAARHASEHGRKDAKDVIRLLLLASMAENFDTARATDYMQPDHFERLELIIKGPEFLSMAEGNSKLAKRLRADASKVFERVQAAYEGTDEGSPQTPPCRPA